MVASAVIVAALLVAPSLAVPVARSSEAFAARDVAAVEEIIDLAARDPKFRLGGFLKKIKNTVGKVAKVAGPIASNFIREDIEPEFFARDLADLAIYEDLAARDPRFGSFLKRLKSTVGKVAKVAGPIVSNFIREDIDLLTERDLVYVDDLAARDPNFFSKLKGIAHRVAKVAMPAARIAAGILIRDEGMEGLLELSERDLDEIAELAARDPKFRLGGFLKKIKNTVSKVAKVAGPIASNFIREDGEDALSARDLEEIVELAERDPKFRLGGLFKKISSTVGKVARVAGPIVGNFIREEDVQEFSAREVAEILELSERDLEDLEDLAVRDPNFFSKFKRIASKVAHVAKSAAPIVSNFIREDAELDEVLARSYDLATLD